MMWQSAVEKFKAFVIVSKSRRGRYYAMLALSVVDHRAPVAAQDFLHGSPRSDGL